MQKFYLALILSALIIVTVPSSLAQIYPQIPPPRNYGYVYTGNATLHAGNSSAKFTVTGTNGITVTGSPGSQKIYINGPPTSTKQGTYNVTQANGVTVNSGGNQINFINGSSGAVKVVNSLSGKQVNVTITSGSAGVTSVTGSGVIQASPTTGAVIVSCPTCGTGTGNITGGGTSPQMAYWSASSNLKNTAGLQWDSANSIMKGVVDLATSLGISTDRFNNIFASVTNTTTIESNTVGTSTGTTLALGSSISQITPASDGSPSIGTSTKRIGSVFASGTINSTTGRHNTIDTSTGGTITIGSGTSQIIPNSDLGFSIGTTVKRLQNVMASLVNATNGDFNTLNTATGNLLTVNTATTFSANKKLTTTPSATTAGINIGTSASDITSPRQGDARIITSFWYYNDNSNTTRKLAPIGLMAHNFTSPSNPATTTSTTGVMSNLFATITPAVTGNILVEICGQMQSGTAGDGAKFDVRYGTSIISEGTAIGNTLVGTTKAITSSTAGGPETACNTVQVTGLTVGTKYFIQIGKYAVTGGTATFSNYNVSILEF